MGEIRLYAISINAVRDMFSASPELATRLREQAIAAFPLPAPKKFGCLSQLGPLLRRPVASYGVRVDVPNADDIEALLAGRFIDPERLIAAWKLTEWWLECNSAGIWRDRVEEATINSLDFQLSCLDVPAAVGLRNVFRLPLGIPLNPGPGLSIGYAKHGQVGSMVETWTPVLGDLKDDVRPLAEALIDWLGVFTSWDEELDLVGLYS